MARIRLPLVTASNGIGAAAPTFREVPGSYQVDPLVGTPSGIKVGILLGDPKLAAATVLVDVPDEDVTDGKLDPVKVRTRYPNHPLVTSGTIK
jgi:hypothetical protein